MFKKIDQGKVELINYSFKQFKIKSFADLGAVWNVDGGYTFYTLKNYDIERAYLVDTNISGIVKCKNFFSPKIKIIMDNFGKEEVVERIGKVDAIFMFDVLLHQVAPDWNKILEMYSHITDNFLIWNPQFLGEKTTRLIDLGIDQYFKNVPHGRDEEPYASLIKKMYEIHPEHNRMYKDIHNVWQWGITTPDIINEMKKLDFENVYHKNHGQWGNLINFESHAFLFKRRVK